AARFIQTVSLLRQGVRRTLPGVVFSIRGVLAEKRWKEVKDEPSASQKPQWASKRQEWDDCRARLPSPSWRGPLSSLPRFASSQGRCPELEGTETGTRGRKQGRGDGNGDAASIHRPEKLATSLRQEARERRIVTDVKPFIGTQRVNNPVR